MIAQDYAKALHALTTEHPRRGKTLLRGLRAALARRGHEKLLPRIFSEYQKLELHAERDARRAKVSPAQERVHILLELYKKLLHGSTSSP